MVICPACQLENTDGEVVCKRCSNDISQGFEDAQTIQGFEITATVDQYSSAASRLLPHHELAAGDVICGRYQIVEMLGRGGMGCVYKVLDRHLDRIVALKTIRPQQASDPDMLRRFKQEILLARQVTHRNVIRIFDFGTDGDLCFITMEHFEGDDLHSLLMRRGKLLPSEVIPLAFQLCEGLASAHAEGVIHRDLKPQNILVNSRNEIRILDFGLADLYDGPRAAAQRRVLAGTPDYMSPEQAKGDPLDARSDLYSLGLVLYELLTGALPFRGDSVAARMQARTVERPASLSSTHPEIALSLSRVIDRCLEKDRPRRYASATEILHDLQQGSLVQQLSGFHTQPASKPTLKWAALIGIPVCVMAAAVWFVHARSNSASSPGIGVSAAAAPYVAVLPLRIVNAVATSDAEGIREAIDSRLSGTHGIHAIAPGAVDKADLSKSEKNVAEQLGANLLLTGQVEDQNGQISVKLNAYDARKDSVVWSDEARGERNDLISLQNQITTRVLNGLQLQPTSPATPPTQNMEAYDLYLQGRSALKEKRNDAAESQKALVMFEQAVSKDSSFALAWTGVADASLNLYRLDHASVDAERAVDAARRASQGSDLPEVHLSAGSVYTQTGRHEEAISEIRRALALQPDSDDAYVRLGRAYLETGQTKAAIAALQNAVRLNPYYWYNQEQLARAYFRDGMDAEALAAFRKVALLKSDSPSAHLGIAGVLVRQGKWAESVPEYKRSLELRKAASAYTSLGSVLFYLGRYSEALPNFQKAAEMQQHDPLVLGNLGSAYRQLGQRAKADGAYRGAIAAAFDRLSVNPRDAMMLGSQALLHAYIGETGEAQAFISRARSIDPSSNELMYDEGVVHAFSGPSQVKSAISALKQAFANGYPVEEAKHDPDLHALENVPEFQALFAGAAK